MNQEKTTKLHTERDREKECKRERREKEHTERDRERERDRQKPVISDNPGNFKQQLNYNENLKRGERADREKKHPMVLKWRKKRERQKERSFMT